MTTKFKIYLSLVFCLVGILSFSSVFAQQALPAGGSSFGTAVKIMPGQYQGFSLAEKQAVYYYFETKPGQLAQLKGKFVSGEYGSFNWIRLYNAEEEELVGNFEEDNKVEVDWLLNSAKASHKIYAKIYDDGFGTESFTLDFSLLDKFDANSGTDAGDTFDKFVTITHGTYNGYLSGIAGITELSGDDWQDIYKIGLKKGVTYEFKVTPPSKTSLTLSLYDLNRQLLKEESSANSGGIISLSLVPSADTNIFVSVLNYEYPYQDALANYQLEIKSSAPVIKFYACDGQYCESVGEFASLADCQKATTKTCYKTENCDGKCEGVEPLFVCTKNSDCPTDYASCVSGKCVDLGEKPPIPACQNECSSGQTKCFDNFNYHKCGDYNKDDCLEWSSPVYCGEGNKCQSGKCVETVGCQCSEWQDTECGSSGCTEDKMAKVRTCTPVACDVEKTCQDDSSCQIIPPLPLPPPSNPNWFGFLKSLKGLGILGWFGGFYIIFWIIFYIYLAICLQILAKKTGTGNGWLAWIPIGNIFLMINIAKKPLWWFVLILIPIVNIVIGVILWMAIAERKNKPNWIGILIIVPVVGIAVPGYLAFFDYKKGKKIEITPPYASTGSQEANKPTVGYKHPCKYCEKFIPPNSTVCPLCGKSNPLGPYRCPKCHEPVEKDWQTCSRCGQNLRIVCPKCGKVTFFGDYCEDCGARLLVTCPHCGQEQPPISDKCIKCGQSLERSNK